MPNNKITSQQQKRRIGLIALMPVVATMAFGINQNVSFAAKVTLKDKTASPLTYEWDFSGGVFGELIPNSNPPAYKRPEGLKTNVQFVRDNARYAVHFSAMDAKNRRCESTINVVIGTPSTGLPNISKMVSDSQKNAPKSGSQLGDKTGDIVVLPYPEMTMQAHTDSRYQQNLYLPATLGSFNTINAQVYSKNRQPQQLSKEDVILQYAAASNKNDPLGKNSITSTSQNYPLGKVGEAAPFQNAMIQKSDMWELINRPSTDKLSKDYMTMSWMDSFDGFWITGASKPDEGFKVQDVEKGAFMPGIDKPFVSNAFQNFTNYNETQHTFSAKNIPVIDIDDSGRVNPYPLMRVQAIDALSKEPIQNAVVDTVVSVAKDFHCSECHEKGKIAANPAVDFNEFKAAFHSSSEYNNGYHCKLPACDKTVAFEVPKFYDTVDKDGKPSTNLADREYATVRNINALHDFYDNLGMNYLTDNGTKDEATGEFGMDMVASCTWCHASMITPIQKTGYPYAFTTNSGKKSGDMMYYPSLSESLHKYHARIQLDPKDKTKILRETSGRPLQWDDSKGANPNTLFPTVDANGKSLPMEQSCLRCHSGHREQLYRDRMFTAGTTCADCHGDMAAVGQVHAKPKAGQEGEVNRVEWLEQPDCGSCHMGDGNLGKLGNGKGGVTEAFSAGVMRRAYDGNDKSATTRKPLTDRFAVQTSEPTIIPKDDWVDSQYSTRHSVLTVSKPLYRTSKDAHGDVACAACHGGSHEIWANRNPNANDNVTALELQGHTGTILECNVCHTADSFKYENDLDAGKFVTDLADNSGVLGGPHNMHPVNDAYWWKNSQNPNDKNLDKTTYGGWHNNYAKKAGKDGEDQCAACHGNDHKGTRLSKTPIDRIFDFSDFDLAKLKAAGFKSNVIKVKAGTQIGCDTCHSIETSCKNSPAGNQCGVASENFVFPKNQEPTITSKPEKLTAIMGESYSYQVKSSDSDGDSLIYSLGLKHAPVKDKDGKVISEMTVDNKGLVTTTWDEAMFADFKHGPFIFPYSINVSDGKGGYAVQNVEMTLECPKGKSWLWKGGQWDGKGSCVAKTDVSITSSPSVVGIDSGASYSYKATAKDAKGLPITYSLENPLDGMTIDDKTGVVNWKAKTVWYGQGFFQVKATNTAGVFDVQMVTLTVCVPAKKWDTKTQLCK
jgi:hypothetical protein